MDYDHKKEIQDSDELRKSIEKQFLLQKIIDNSSDALFVTDRFGNVLLANKGAAQFVGYKVEEMIGRNVEEYIQEGLYDWSPTIKATKTRSIVLGNVRNNHGVQYMVTSNPIMDENNEIVMIITTVRNKDLVDEYIATIAKDGTTVSRSKTVEEDLVSSEPVAESKQMRQIIKISNVIAKTDSTIMLIGETGTGKEVMARYIHRNSLRSKELFIPVNCAAIPDELLESEFFGYARGAFTGANPQGKPGLFEVADKGTLFLDEIAELPLAMQSKLLRVLESSEAQRLGDTKIYQTDVRIIAATNKDLNIMISQKLFRSDLYYRLNVIPIKLSPLKERPEDILVFAHEFLEELNRKYSLKKVFSTQTTQAFLNYSWPGNVRELRNVVERLVITSDGDIINFEDESLLTRNTCLESEECSPEKHIAYSGTLKSVLKAVEEEYINQVLAECGGRVGEAAQRLGIHRTMLYRKSQKVKGLTPKSLSFS
ncbi:sigma 54-interacting transcriptional regulator [Desulfosporosinus sp. Sb-LF]|uniref:sigma-54 interaction domain-containing protein n=1 Tax=Desulfosporosinus sp. Sb-LF TaxID=2560027 RepID=UPI001FB0A928|nr:sigma 54-interacting transcriptional regulator [Desulfosporosinus sp. Sb-LF]